MNTVAHRTFFKHDMPCLADERHEKRQSRKAFETEQKAKATARDRACTKTGCRWPDCPYCVRRDRQEVSHVWDKGSGGDHGNRSTADQMIRVCARIHQGPGSIHAKDRVVIPLTDRGTDGPCEFQVFDRAENRWFTVGVESAPGVLVRN